MFALVHAVVGPFFGPIAERFGPRRVIMAGGGVVALGLALTAETAEPWQLYLSFGVITAVGVGFSGYVPLVILIRGWFPARIGTAVGIATAGISMGITILVPVCQLLIDHVGWRWAFRVLGLAVVGWLVPATLWLLRERPLAAGSDDPDGGGALVDAAPARAVLDAGARRAVVEVLGAGHRPLHGQQRRHPLHDPSGGLPGGSRGPAPWSPRPSEASSG